MAEINVCRFCGAELSYTQENEDYSIGYGCPVCGHYAISRWDFRNGSTFATLSKDIVATFLYHNNKIVEKYRPESFTLFIGSQERFNGLKANHPHYHYTSVDEIKAFWKNKFSARIDKILLALSQRSQFYGEQMYLSNQETQSLMFITRFSEYGQELEPMYVSMQLTELSNYLQSIGYARINWDGEGTYITLLSDGWRRVDALQQQDYNNKNVFVSMSFAEEMDPVREAIRKGIIDAGFSAEFMDEMIHNKQIVPEMFRLIRECRFLIMDISEPNYGAYYEAGYALGLGKEVIITCKTEAKKRELTDQEKPFEKYLRPHFDIAQKQILFWDDFDDLSRKLKEWIKALFR